MSRCLSLFLTLIMSCDAFAGEGCFPPEVLPDNMFPVVDLVTSRGTVTIELNRNRSPATVNNFLRYVLAGHYDNTLFHRVVADFVIQGGGYTPEYVERPVHEPVLNESGNGLQNSAGTIAMARFNDPHSATSQFFINLKDNDSLNPNSRSWGYTVFGEVISGFDVAEAIGSVETRYDPGLDAQDVPVEAVMLIEARVRD